MSDDAKVETKVAVVFASFNRKEVALECIARLRAQTRQPDRVVVADNASEDGSAEAMRELAWECLEVIDTGGNLGNAGAVRMAMEHSFEEGCDAVWILDDDSWPRRDALEGMLADDWDPEVLRHPLQEDPATGRFTWPLQLVHDDGTVTMASSVDELPPGKRLRSRGVWTGALISRRIREVAGPVNAELFIRGEDEEYPWRIEQAGFRSEAVRAAVLDHPGPKDLVRLGFLGRSLFLERGLSNWKLYYKVRNMVWLKRAQSGLSGALAMSVAYGLALMRFGEFRLISAWFAGVRDGLAGRLGRKDFGP
ncbi:glycosyltransferase family 2 [Haloferula helveola]|uniref:Glycosyltransferase family 2 n=1 Tax=Haloferula helveola TaxID=490095 RepID=A0ABM7RDY4_9BACT|nr:glycosyltransferase family 2 [Haloferula helveola]